MGCIAINWGSTNFRAYLLDADGRLLDEMSDACGVSGLPRNRMVEIVAGVVNRWPDAHDIIMSGMIGSNVGWIEAPYRVCPTSIRSIGEGTIETMIGDVCVHIIPGLTCRGPHGLPDIMRGEEVELSGAFRLSGAKEKQHFIALPGTHTKWASVTGGVIDDFFTSMSGEIFDRLTRDGLLASITDGRCEAGEAFSDGVGRGLSSGLSLGPLLFSARALVVRGELSRGDSGSYLRGILIGSEIRDAITLYPALTQAGVTLVGSREPCSLYHKALCLAGVEATIVDARDAALAGYAAVIESAFAVSGR